MDLALFKSYELLLLLLLLLKRFPVFQASKANEPTHAFYSLPEFESWKNETENWKAWKVKYYKGRFVGLLVCVCVCVCVSKHFQQWTFSINTVEPHYNEGPWYHENYLVISGFSLYQGKITKKYKELGPAK